MATVEAGPKSRVLVSSAISSMSKALETVQVTGGTGFIGSHIILQLLEKGYRVRASVRTGKTNQLRQMYPDATSEQLDAVEVADIVTGDFSSAFLDVGALIHVASPIVTAQSGGTTHQILDSAIGGTTNVLSQAIKANVKRIVWTSSWAALYETDLKAAFQPNRVDETWWGTATFDQATKMSFPLAYMASKTLAEKEAWKLAEENNVDLTTILPPMVYGAFIPNFPTPTSRSGLATNEYIYHLIAGGADGSRTYPRLGVGHFASVRDVAKAHVLALGAPPLPAMKRKRLIVIGGKFTWPEAAEYLVQARPELKERLVKDEAGPRTTSCAVVDMSLTKEVIGMEVANMISWKECILEAVDYLLMWEKSRPLAV